MGRLIFLERGTERREELAFKVLAHQVLAHLGELRQYVPRWPRKKKNSTTAKNINNHFSSEEKNLDWREEQEDDRRIGYLSDINDVVKPKKKVLF